MTRSPEPVQVMLLGDLNIDLGLDVQSFPSPGGDGVAHRQRLGFGGSAANTAVVLQRLGVSTAMLSSIGEDAWGDAAISGLSSTGVGCAHVRRIPDDPTSLNVIAVTPDGERTMLAYRGASRGYRSEMLPALQLQSAQHLHISGYALLEEPQREAATRAVALARAAGLTVSLDVPVDPVTAVPELLIGFAGQVDAIVIGSDEAQRLTGTPKDHDAAATLAAQGAELVAVKQGAAGSLLLRRGESVQVPAPRVPVVDSTGAGDAYCAGLIWALLNETQELRDIGRLAGACGAAAVGIVGAGEHMPGRGELDKVLAAYNL